MNDFYSLILMAKAQEASAFFFELLNRTPVFIVGQKDEANALASTICGLLSFRDTLNYPRGSDVKEVDFSERGDTSSLKILELVRDAEKNDSSVKRTQFQCNTGYSWKAISEVEDLTSFIVATTEAIIISQINSYEKFIDLLESKYPKFVVLDVRRKKNDDPSIAFTFSRSISKNGSDLSFETDILDFLKRKKEHLLNLKRNWITDVLRKSKSFRKNDVAEVWEDDSINNWVYDGYIEWRFKALESSAGITMSYLQKNILVDRITPEDTKIITSEVFLMNSLILSPDIPIKRIISFIRYNWDRDYHHLVTDNPSTSRKEAVSSLFGV